MLVARAAESQQTTVKRAIIGVAVLIQVVAFYSYERHYKVCQAWKGWFICCIGAVLTSLVIQHVVFNTEPKSDAAPPPSSSAIKTSSAP